MPCSHKVEELEVAEAVADSELGRVEDSGADEVDSGLDEAEMGAVTDKEAEALANLKVSPRTVP